MQKIKVGVVGVGHMGEYHVRIYNEIPEVDVVAVCDIDKKRLEDISSLYKVRPFSDYTQLFHEVSVVSIAVPTSLHYEIARDFLNHGKHVLLEKPMTLRLDQAEDLVRLARSKGLVFQVGHVERFNAAVQEMKSIVKDPFYIECRRLGPFNHKRTNDTGVILDLLIHDIDVVLDLVECEVSRINVAGASICTDFEDIVNVQFVFENGCIASITSSRVSENKIRTLSVCQKDAYISLDYASQDLHIYRQASSWYFPTQDLLKYKQESFIERIFVHKDNPLKLELQHFVRCITNNETPKTSSESDIRALSVALEIQDKLYEDHKMKVRCIG